MKNIQWNLKVNFGGKRNRTIVLSTFLGKTFFAWRFILNENILFWLTMSYQKPHKSYIFTVKLNLRQKICLTYAISFIVKWFFGVFVKENIFYFSLLNLNYWCFTTILWKFQKNWTSGTLNICLQATYPTDFWKNSQSFLQWGKVKIFDFFLKIQWLV